MKNKSLLRVPVLNLGPNGLDVAGDVSASELDLPEDDQIQCPNPVRIQLHLSRVSNGILSKGTATTTLRCRCDRCLEIFDYELRVEDICHFDEDVQEDILDLTAPIREDILIAFPQHTVCRETCGGLCLQCGQNLNAGTCSCGTSPGQEAPWGMLDNLDLDSE